MEKKIRIGIIGCGGIANGKHMPALKAIDKCEMVAFCDIIVEKAQAAAEKFASDSDSELGKIKHAYQGQFSITDRDSNTPYIKKVRVVTTIDYYLED